jgi:hypothetical protein
VKYAPSDGLHLYYYLSFFFVIFIIFHFCFLDLFLSNVVQETDVSPPFYFFVLRKPCPLLKTVYSLLQNVSLSNSFLVNWLGCHGERSAFVVSIACIQYFLLTVLFEVHVLLRITHVGGDFSDADDKLAHELVHVNIYI